MNHFNLASQKGQGWLNRAAIAAGMIRKHVSEGSVIADLGCGDMKLRDALGDFRCEYRGYDLNPQSQEVTQLDITKAHLPECDVSVLLGVLEYIPVPAVLQKIRSSKLVVSHVYADEGAFTPKLINQKGWINCLPLPEFEGQLRLAGFSIVEREMTGERMQHVWLCQERA